MSATQPQCILGAAMKDQVRSSFKEDTGPDSENSGRNPATSLSSRIELLDREAV